MSRKVLITGSTSGLGLFLAGNVFRHDEVVICGSSQERLEEASLKLSKLSQVHSFRVDFSSEKQTSEFCDRVLQDFGTPEIVIHALGASLKAPFESPVEKWNQVMRLNFLAAVQIDNYFLPRMITCNNGRLVYIGSMASVTLDGLEPYVVAKTALDAYVKILGRRLAGSGVCASAIRPGPINVPDRYLTNLELNDPESWLAWAAEHRIREKKLLRMEEIGRLAEMLCSQDLSYINGSIFDLFGGSY